MSNELKPRAGDVVRLKPVTVAAIGDHDFLPEESCREGYFSADLIEAIISRAETDAEKIARLEAELAKAPRRIEWGGGECPLNCLAKVVVWFKDPEEQPRTFDSDDIDWTHTNHSRDIIAYMVLPE